jgi:hypothetical protein
MHIELTDEERRRAQQGLPLDAVDPQTNEAYVLIAKPRFEEVRSHLGPVSVLPAKNGKAQADAPELEIPEGVRLSREAYRRDLPELLEQKNLYHQWVAYHRHQRLGIAKSQRTLIVECYRRGLASGEFYVGWIDSCGLIEEEEVEPRPQHFVENEDEDS